MQDILSSGRKKNSSWHRMIRAAILSFFVLLLTTPTAWASTDTIVSLPTAPTLNGPAQGTEVVHGDPVITGWVTHGLLVEVHIDHHFNGWATVQPSETPTDSFYYYPFLTLAPGAHTLQLRAKDPETGLRSEPTPLVTFRVADRLPAPTLLSPVVKPTEEQQPVIVGLTYSDTVVEVFVDNMSRGTVNAAGESTVVQSFAFQTPRLTTGSHEAYVVARDMKGRESQYSNVVRLSVPAQETVAATTTTTETSDKSAQTDSSGTVKGESDQKKSSDSSKKEDSESSDDNDSAASKSDDQKKKDDQKDDDKETTTAATDDKDDADDDNRSAIVTWIVVIAVLVVILALRLRGNSSTSTVDHAARSVFGSGPSQGTGGSENSTDKTNSPPPPPPSSTTY